MRIEYKILSIEDVKKLIFDESILIRFERQLRLFKMVAEKLLHYTEDSLANELNVSLSTIRRDFARLRKIGIHIHGKKKIFRNIKS